MKRCFLGLAGIPILLVASSVHAAPLPVLYVAENTAGTGSGTSCANAGAVAFFNASNNWGTATGQIGPGSVVHLCGTITSQLTVHGSGTSSQPLELLWEPSASLQVCSTGGALILSGQRYVVVDLGGNTSAISCPNNGTGLASTVQAEGIYGTPAQNIEIRNGTIGPLYVHSDTSGDGANSTGIYVYGGTNNHFHDVSIHDARFCIFYAIGNGVTANDDELDHLTLSACGDTVWYASGDDNGTANNPRIHDNAVTIGANWFDTADTFHMEYLHLFTQAAAGSSLNNVLVYNDTVVGPMPNHMTSFFFVDGSAGANQGTISGALFNEVYVAKTGTAPGDGLIYAAGTGNTFAFYNNTIDCSSNTNSTIGSELEGAGSSYTVENNVFEHCQYAIANNISGPTLTADDNDYFDVGSGGWVWQGTNASTLAGWRTASNQDTHAIATDPGLTASYLIASTSSAAYHAGTNLTSVAISELSLDKAGVARAASGPWDLGAYAYCSGSACGPSDGGTSDAGDAAVPPADAGPSTDAGTDSGESNDAGAFSDSGLIADGNAAPPPSSSAESSSGCGCRTARSKGFGAGTLWGIALALVGIVRRRHHTRTRAAGAK